MEKMPAKLLKERKARVLMDGYALGFTGREFNIDNYLEISASRHYKIVMHPNIKRWTFNGPVKEVMYGRYRLYYMLNRTHGESFLNWFHDEDNEIKKKMDRKCFLDKGSITEELIGVEDRKQCILWSNLSHGSQVVEVAAGSMVTNIKLHFPDIRYVESRNLVYFQLGSEEDTGIEPSSFVGTIYPVLDSGFRRLSDLKNSVFVRPEEATVDSPVDKNAYDNIEQDVDNPEELQRINTNELSNDELKEMEAIRKELESQTSGSEQAVTYQAQEVIELLNVKESIAYIREQKKKGTHEKMIFTKKPKSKNLSIYKKVYGLSTEEEYKIKNQGMRDIISRDKVNEFLLKYSEHKDSGNINEMTTKLEDATVENICEALYPKNNSSEEEAQDYANNLQNIDKTLYNNRKETLCRINHLVSGGKLDEVDSREPCQDTKVICSEATSDIVKDSILIDTYNILYGADKALKEEGCIELDDQSKGILDSIVQTAKDAWHSIGAGKDMIDEQLEALRQGAFYETIRNSTTRELSKNFSNMKLQIKLHNPEKLNPRNPEHLEQIQRYQPFIKQERCKKNPDDYIELAFSEHILNIKDKPPIRESDVDSKNITISSMIFLTKGETISDINEKALGASDYLQRLNSIGVEAAFSGGLKIFGTGAEFTEKQQVTGMATATAGEHWYIRSIKEKSHMYSKIMGEAAARTINAEEITFRFTADVQYCFNIKGSSRDISSPMGIIYCSNEIKTIRIQETWWHFYLYFRNKASIIQDAASSLTQRPWDIIVRGKDNYEKVLRLLQSDRNISISPAKPVGVRDIPGQVLSAQEFQYKTRSEINFPGLLRYQNIWIEEDPK